MCQLLNGMLTIDDFELPKSNNSCGISRAAEVKLSKTQNVKRARFASGSYRTYIANGGHYRHNLTTLWSCVTVRSRAARPDTQFICN